MPSATPRYTEHKLTNNEQKQPPPGFIQPALKAKISHHSLLGVCEDGELNSCIAFLWVNTARWKLPPPVLANQFLCVGSTEPEGWSRLSWQVLWEAECAQNNLLLLRLTTYTRNQPDFQPKTEIQTLGVLFSRKYMCRFLQYIMKTQYVLQQTTSLQSTPSGMRFWRVTWNCVGHPLSSLYSPLDLYSSLGLERVIYLSKRKVKI